MAKQKRVPRIVGTGLFAPSKKRGNKDPIFDWIYKNEPTWSQYFDGYIERRVLGEGEDLMTMMVPASRRALKNAGKTTQDVDILLGTGSVSHYRTPNELAHLHKLLKLQERVWTVPVTNDFSNFNASVLFADGLITAKRVKTALICIGGNWTQNVSYRTMQCISAGDAAGAAVMEMSEDPSKYYLVDHCTLTRSKYYGGMYTVNPRIKLNPKQQGYEYLFGPHVYEIEQLGLDGFKEFAGPTGVAPVMELLKRHKLKGSDIDFMPQQSSGVMLKSWDGIVQPATCINTLTKYANITVAEHAVNMAWAEANNKFTKDYLIIQALGPDIHASAILLKRG